MERIERFRELSDVDSDEPDGISDIPFHDGTFVSLETLYRFNHVLHDCVINSMLM
jgi:hypothetical protein